MRISIKKPNDLIPPKDKGKAWHLRYVQHLYFDHARHGCGFRDRTAIARRRDYSIANQDTSGLREKLKCDEKNKKDGTISLDFRPLPLMVKAVQIVKEMILKNVGIVEVNAIDPISVNEKEEKQRKIKINSILNETFAALEAETGMNIMGEEERETPVMPEELEIYSFENAKLSSERDLEDVIELVREQSFFKDLCAELAENLVVDGLGVYLCEINDKGFIVPKVLDTEYAILPYPENNSFKDMAYGGHVEFVEKSKVLSFLMENEKLTKDDARKVLEMSEAFSNRGEFYYDNQMYRANEFPQLNQGSDKIPVACIYWKSVDRQIKGITKDEKGNTKIVDLEEDMMALDKAIIELESNLDTKIEKTIENVYYSYWIIGTDYQMKYGKMYNMPRDAMYPQFTRIPIRVEYATMKNGIFQSFVSLSEPLVDRIMEAYMKLQDSVARSRPKGLAIDVSKLREVAMQGETKMQPKDIIDFYFRTGILVYSGSVSGGIPPFTELENGLAQSAMQFHDLMIAFNMMLKEMGSMNEGIDGTTPNSEMGIGVMKQLESNTNAALSNSRRAMESFSLNTSRDIIDLVPMAAQENPDQFIYSLGSTTTEFLKEMKKARSYGLKISQTLSNEFHQEILDLAKTALSLAPEQGGIEMGDFIAIRNAESAKQAAALYNLYSKRRKLDYQKAQSQSIQANTEAQVQSAAAATQRELELATALAEIEVNKETQLHQLKMQLEQMKQQTILQKAQMDNATREEVAAISGEALISSKDMENEDWKEISKTQQQTTILKTDMDNEAKLQQIQLNNASKERIANKKPSRP